MIIDMPTVSMGNSGSIVSADKVSYDNTESGLTADNVQDAIDEMNTKLLWENSISYDMNTTTEVSISENGLFVFCPQNSNNGRSQAVCYINDTFITNIDIGSYGGVSPFSFPVYKNDSVKIVVSVGSFFTQYRWGTFVPYGS